MKVYYNYSIISLFPEIFYSWQCLGVVSRAIGLDVNLFYVNPKHFSGEKLKIDDTPYGGGAGLIMKYQPLKNSLNYAKTKNHQNREAKTILLTPQGKVFKQQVARQLLSYQDIIFICGRYEGIDQRFIDKNVDLELSIGDFILTGGEIALLTILDTIIRLMPNCLNNNLSLDQESFSNNILEYPQYTKPREIDGLKVPNILLTGDHKNINKWRKKKAFDKTLKNRPDLIDDKSI